ncbi:MAG TPA: Na+/H+ antiporter NhaA [Steroidobacteraceae bacterium]|nr:Na+/H+ antiporter NhaA [Steroidobacteraceae bacterium]
MSADSTPRRLLRPIDPGRDHVRGGGAQGGDMAVLIYGDFLCPYCRRLREVLQRVRHALGERLVYVFRHYPNERAHPGSELAAIGAEAAARQGRFWDMYDALYDRDPDTVDQQALLRIARSLRLDLERFEHDLQDPGISQRVQEDLAEGRRNGVSGTPTIFVDGIRYDGAWDFYSLLEALERPLGARVQRTARAFANLPTSAGLALLIAAGTAIVCANSPLKPLYQQLVNARFGVGLASAPIALSIAQWCSEGLLAIFYLILGLEIRREMTVGSLMDWRAAVAPLLSGVTAVAVPAGVYLTLNSGAAASGWSIPADTGVAFSLAILALFGLRASAGLKVFVTTYAIANDITSTLVLAIFYPRTFSPEWLLAAAGAVTLMALFARWRVYAIWPYLLVGVGLWLTLHWTGVSGALSGIAVAAFLPRRPAASATPLLAQAATALAELEDAEQQLESARGEPARAEQETVQDWAARNLRAASDRLSSPAERVESAVEPWSTYVALPVFAFTAAGVPLAANFQPAGATDIFLGVLLALALAKPLGILFTVWAAAKARIAIAPNDASPLALVGAAFLCGIADPFSFYMADQVFQTSAYASVAKIGVLAGSGLAAVFGALALASSPAPVTKAG